MQREHYSPSDNYPCCYLTLTDPSPPSPPSDLQVSHTTFGSDSSVSVHVSWVSPADPDVPVHHYKLSWSLALSEGGYTTQSKLKKRKTVSGVIPTHLSTIFIFNFLYISQTWWKSTPPPPPRFQPDNPLSPSAPLKFFFFLIQ